MRKLMTMVAATALMAATAVAVSATPAAALDNGLARTPYLGWNTYYGLGSDFNEQTIDSVADAIVDRGLKAAGYRYVWIDGGWWSGSRDADGNITVDATQWPHGMKAVADYIHSKGLLAGIYTDAGQQGCGGNNQGSYGHYQQDVDQFAGWGFDAVKVDFCGGTALKLDPATAYGQFRDALLNNSSHRPMLFNICNPFTPDRLGPGDPPFERSAYNSYSFGPSSGNSWRTDTDVGFSRSIQWPDVLRNLDDDAAHPEAAGPGHWNDPDYLGPELGMTADESRAQFTMWSMVAAPLIIGSDVRGLSQQTIDVLTNQDVLAVDQDPLGVQGTRVAQQGDGDVWVKPLANGDRAVAFLNRSANPVTLSTSASTVGLGHSAFYTLHNLWTNDSTETAGTITATVPANSAVLYRVSTGGNGIAPATDLTAPAVPVTAGSERNIVAPASTLPATATLRNDGREPIIDARLTLDAPAGWHVTGDINGRTVPPAQTLSTQWHVQVPPGTLPGSYTLTGTADYRWGGTHTATRSSSVSVIVPQTPPSGSIALSSRPWIFGTSGWMVPRLNGEVGGGPMSIHGQRYADGIGTASPSRIEYYLGDNCSTLSTTVGIDDAVNFDPSGGTAQFQVFGDGTKLYDSGVIDRTQTRTITVDVTGVHVLALAVGDGGDNTYNDRADWAALHVTCGPPAATAPDGPWPTYVPHATESATASSANDGYPASNAIDGDLTTIWHSEFSPMHVPLPISLTVDLGQAQHVSGLTYQTRLDGTSTGTITGYQVQISLDGTTFSTVASGSWSDDSSIKSVAFTPSVARYVRLVATAGDNGYASAAEINVATTG